MPKQCPCGKDKPYQHCCGRFLSGQQQAKTPEQLMRSRYCAYALGGHGEYLLKTWHPMMSQTLSVEALSEKSVDWTGLDVMAKSQAGDHGSVEFNAFFINTDGNHEMLHEHSVFQRIGGLWLYVGATVETD